MFCVINIVALLFFSIAIGYKYRESVVSTISVTMCSLIIILLGLAYLRKLEFIDYISVFLIAYCIRFFFKNKKDFQEYLSEYRIYDKLLVVVCIYMCVCFIAIIRIASHWDELGVWAIEVKSLYFLNGFAEKGKHVAIEFGDYYPAQMLYEWWTCHFVKGNYIEGLMYVGYYWLYISFLMPAIGKIRLYGYRYVLVPIVSVVVFLVLPSITDVFSYSFLSVELLMSATYGALLFAIFSSQKSSKEYVRLQILLYSMILLLLKETGVIYIAMFLFLVIGLKYCRSQLKQKITERNIDLFKPIEIILLELVAILPVVSWKIFCIAFDRRKYFDGLAYKALKDILKGRYIMWKYTMPQIKSFFNAMIWQPLHHDKSWGIDLTIITFIILFVVIVYLLVTKEKILEQSEGKFLVVHYLICFSAYSILLLAMHLFVFQEKRYIQPDVMINSFARYEEPLFLGIIIFLILLYMSTSEIQVNCTHRRTILIVLGITFLCANWELVYNNMIKYSVVRNQNIEIRENLCLEQESFLNCLERVNENSARVLFVAENAELPSTRTLQYVVCPYSVVFIKLEPEDVIEQKNKVIEETIKKYNCDYLYFDSVSEDIVELKKVNNNEIYKIRKDGEETVVFDSI